MASLGGELSLRQAQRVAGFQKCTPEGPSHGHGGKPLWIKIGGHPLCSYILMAYWALVGVHLLGWALEGSSAEGYYPLLNTIGQRGCWMRGWRGVGRGMDTAAESKEPTPSQRATGSWRGSMALGRSVDGLGTTCRRFEAAEVVGDHRGLTLRDLLVLGPGNCTT